MPTQRLGKMRKLDITANLLLKNHLCNHGLREQKCLELLLDVSNCKHQLLVLCIQSGIS